MNEQIREGFVIDAATPLDEKPAAPAADDPIDFKDWVWRCPFTVKLLHKPIIGNSGETLNELTFREPTGGDIIRHGNPVRFNAEGVPEIDERKMTNMMGQLSGVLAPLLNAMHPVDWNSCAQRLQFFFVPDRRSW
jgi:hypothetical protein